MILYAEVLITVLLTVSITVRPYIMSVNYFYLSAVHIRQTIMSINCYYCQKRLMSPLNFSFYCTVFQYLDVNKSQHRLNSVPYHSKVAKVWFSKGNSYAISLIIYLFKSFNSKHDKNNKSLSLNFHGSANLTTFRSSWIGFQTYVLSISYKHNVIWGSSVIGS